ncbi:M16 family metallopeptidase [Hathewaya limosa]|uniref:Zn-dependent peptidase n=1 Tax=Hathewaya limosa TaxID=1536 RepID=A0ABU0JSS5_HATLI|nr:pitrilysin family protein [Hathewaya limosa]MDQ0480139.1 putative Zn-dependent peptidase [Hathewaya limosa]
MYELVTLANGLRIVLEHIEYVNSVSVGIWIENGSRNEEKLNSGISHFIEHMLFKDTYKRTAKQIVEDIEDVGGQINAFTSKEATCFYVKLLDSHLDLGLDVLSDMLFNGKFLEEDIEKEKKVVIEEIKMNDDNPEDVLSDIHILSAYGNDTISMPILGTEESVNKLNRDSILEYMSKYYVPQNTVISICGNFNKNNIYSQIENYFGTWQRSKNKKSFYSTPKMENKFLFRQKDIEQTYFSLGLQGLPIGHKDSYSLILLTNLFGGGASSNLFQKIREELGLCYTIYSYSSALVNTGIITIYAALNSEFIKEAYNEIEKEIFKFSKESLGEEKLRKAKEQLKGNYILGLESTSSRMFNNGKTVINLNKINKPDEILKKIDNINLRDIDRVLDETFRKGIINAGFVSKDYELVKNSLPINIKSI